jgi:hypothetical protein
MLYSLEEYPESHKSLHQEDEDNKPRLSAFPNIEVSEERIISAAMNVNRYKAGSWDCVPNGLFNIFGNCCKNGRCHKCEAKITILKDISTR